MKDIKIPKEISGYEAKLIGSFTARQALSLFIGLMIMVLTCIMLREYFYAPVIIAVCSFILLPFIAIGWLKPHGVKIEKIAKLIYTSTFRTRKRGYKITNKSLKTIKYLFIKKKIKDEKNKSKPESNQDGSKILSKRVSDNLNKLTEKEKGQFKLKTKRTTSSLRGDKKV